ncbi:MAG: PDZ domain-containing protein [Sphaerobacteraceae bacterium]|nr:MAG: PDZ domain-containing protein [Sphaerobacteraceae bacterium]
MRLRSRFGYPTLLAILASLTLIIAACSTGTSTSDDASDVTGNSETPAAVSDDQDVQSTAAQATDDEDDAVIDDDAANDDEAADDAELDIDVSTDDAEEIDEERPADEPSDVELAVEKVRPAVVFLSVQVQSTGAFGMPEEQEGVGSGVIFDEGGHILTNNHVIEGASTINVVLPDGRSYEGNVVGRSPDRDLAIVDIDTDDELPVAELGVSGDLRIGQSVVAIGNALGLPGGPTVTTGVVSALGRTIQAGMGQPPMESLVQTDAAINPGNSGGPLINLNGEVIGINTARIQQAEGIGFAVSVDTARNFVQQVVDQEPQPYIGISGLDISPAIAQQQGLPVDSGVLIIEVSPGTPAEESGVQPGDILRSMNGVEIETVQELQSELENYEPGDEVTLTLNRDGSETEITLTLGESPIVQ